MPEPPPTPPPDKIPRLFMHKGMYASTYKGIKKITNSNCKGINV